MHERLRPADLLLTLAIVAIWGFSFVPMAVALREIPPFLLAALRFALAALPAVLFVRPPAMPWPGVVAYGAAIGVVQFGLLFLGIALGMPPGLASLVIQVQAFFTIGLAILFAGDRLHRWSAVGAAIAAAGVVVLAWHKIAGGASGTALGFACVIGAALAWAVGNVIAKRAGAAHDVDALSLVAWSSLLPPIPLAAASWAFEGGADAFRTLAHASWIAWVSLAFMSWAATVFAWGAWNRMLHRYPTPLISPFTLLVPVSGMTSAAIFLGERLAPAQAAGALLVLAGLVVNVAGPLLSRRASG